MSFTGTVARWNSRKGIGFISCPDFEHDVFVHVSAFGGGELIEGSTVQFDAEDEPTGKKRATKVIGAGVDPSRRPGEGGFNQFGGGSKGDRPRYESNGFGFSSGKKGGKGSKGGFKGNRDNSYYNNNNNNGNSDSNTDGNAFGSRDRYQRSYNNSYQNNNRY